MPLWYKLSALSCPALFSLKNPTFRLLPQLCHIVDPGSGSPVQWGRGASHPHRNPLYSTVQYSTLQYSTEQSRAEKSQKWEGKTCGHITNKNKNRIDNSSKCLQKNDIKNYSTKFTEQLQYIGWVNNIFQRRFQWNMTIS